MIRKEAIEIICSKIKNSTIVSANGFISRDLYETNDKSDNFYMIGSMGLASSIALGIALKKTKRRICVFDGDGNILMNLGSLVTIGSLKPKNLIHFVFDNSSHESTGGQPTMSSKIEIDKIAKSVKYKTFNVKNKNELEKTIQKIKKISGPIFVLVKIKKSKKVSKRVEHEPEQIRENFMKSVSKF